MLKMKFVLSVFVIILILACKNPSVKKTESLFDGKTFSGWEGDTINTWRIDNGTITGGSLDSTVPGNDFLCTDRTFDNFILKLKIKLAGTEGFINSGIQFRSKRLKEPSNEMEGYQADWGEGYWASLYDESRRNETLIAPDSVEVLKWIKVNEWNDYEVRAEGHHISLFINGHQTIDYIESDESIPQSGLIGFQIHGGGKAEASFKDITIEELK